MASLGDEEGQRVGGLARPPTVSSHHPKLPNQDLRERLEDCTVGNQEADGQGPRAGGSHGESQHGRNPGSGSRGIRSKLASLWSTKGTPVCGLPGMFEDSHLFTGGEQGLRGREGSAHPQLHKD